MRFSAGETFDRYVIEALLGEGGMGEVYRAADTRLRRKVALKVMRRSASEGAETWGRAVARMQREARAAAGIGHSGIVAVYDVGEHEGTPFIAMELVEGKPLRSVCGNADVPLSTRLRILLDVARALAAAHQKGLVHRDIKPENVMLRGDGAVKVLDFGIARQVRTGADPMASTVEGSISTLTGEGAFVGTPAYMAPEQVRGEPIDARADQFAWGILAYELISGRLPFRTEGGGMRLIASILSDTPAPLDGVPEVVESIVLRALEKAPEDRFGSMAEVAEQLAAVVTGEAQKTPTTRRKKAQSGSMRPGRARSSRPPPPRRAGAKWALGAVLLVLLAGGLWRGLRHRAAPPLPAATEAAAPRPTAVTDLPLPHSDKPEALLAYREGMQAIRDASWDTARAAFDRARKADPSLAAAHMRSALIGVLHDRAVSREAYRKAVSLRVSLSERDQAFLDAIEPFIQRDPPDRATLVSRMKALSTRYPGDAEIVFWQAWTDQMGGFESDDAAALLDMAERCLAIDPKYADCWQTKEMALITLGRTDEALVAIDRCLEISAGAVDCLRDRALIQDALGQCDAMEATARRWVATDPGSGKPYAMLARSLYAQGASAAAVRGAIDQASRRFRANGLIFEAERTEILTMAALGDLAAAYRRADEAAAQGSEALPPDEEMLFFLARAQLREELGRIDEAVQIADAFLARHAVMPKLDHDNLWTDATVYMLAVKRRAGRLSQDEFEKARADWIASVQQGSRPLAWEAAYGVPASTPEEAKEALDARAQLAPSIDLRHYRKAIAMRSLMGKLHLLAGDPTAALPLLQASARACVHPDFPLGHLHNKARLGMALEATGDKAGACGAYQSVLFRWGEAKASVTAKEVTRRAKALGCDVKGGS
ncbi:protein kinase domain-containing protein [Polyangium aurulentum]|uniref:serine/threonine-protein kinase n=1 Tax=Polyangium aurulentum TaxID=2567896 RepID=UPI0010AE28FE|nr:serine/threonine-protein kinase [Polyangium aurulentum]UQA60871.1 protein kinase [Polyangium aurulentum]